MLVTPSTELQIAITSSQPKPETAQSTETTRLRFAQHEAEMVAKTVWGEARGLTEDEWRLVVWCICNRADDQSNDFRRQTTVESVVTAKSQFHGYSKSNPVDPKILEVVTEVLTAWSNGEEPLVIKEYCKEGTPDYLFFTGNGVHNYFRREWR